MDEKTYTYMTERTEAYQKIRSKIASHESAITRIDDYLRDTKINISITIGSYRYDNTPFSVLEAMKDEYYSVISDLKEDLEEI